MHRFILSLVFVALYGSGFVATQFGMPYAEPLAFLTVRFFISAVFLFLLCIFLKQSWPANIKQTFHIAISGILLVGVFSIGVFISLDFGISAATSSLIISMQPLLVALISIPLLGEKLNKSQWLGLCIGMLGLLFILGRKFNLDIFDGIAFSVLGLLGLAIGSVYQKYFCSNMNIFSGGVIHSLSSGILCLVLAFAFEENYIDWQPQFIFSLLWMSVVVSIGALLALYVLIGKYPVSQVSSLFFLIPVSAVLLSVLFFNKQLDYIEIIGIIITSIAVFAVNWLQIK